VVILGGGLSGLAAALELAESGVRRIVVLERGPAAGGLAGSFEREGHSFPLGYHHILQKDKTLLQVLARIGAADAIRWRRVGMLFEANGRLHDLGTPLGFARFPMPLPAKARFVAMMLRAFTRTDWTAWEGRSARELIDAWGGRTVRETIFEPLCQLKFHLPCDEVSAAWLGARLSFREGSMPLGYIPGANWTQVLCEGLARLVRERGVDLRLSTAVEALETDGARVRAAVLRDGERIDGDIFISSVAPPAYLRMLPDDRTPTLADIRYTALVSAVCAAPRLPLPPFYWLNLSGRHSSACAMFRLDALNPTIGGDRMCINFVSHLPDARDPVFAAADDDLMRGYLGEFARLFGQPLAPDWVHIARVPMYSPVFTRAFRNPPARSGSFSNVYFAGNYRTFPSVASTGTAMASGFDAARTLMDDLRAGRLSTALPEAA
jgi:protoporphyrinogen oxidase